MIHNDNPNPNDSSSTSLMSEEDRIVCSIVMLVLGFTFAIIYFTIGDDS